jgi:hypothetical protein
MNPQPCRGGGQLYLTAKPAASRSPRLRPAPSRRRHLLSHRAAAGTEIANTGSDRLAPGGGPALRCRDLPGRAFRARLGSACPHPGCGAGLSSSRLAAHPVAFHRRLPLPAGRPRPACRHQSLYHLSCRPAPPGAGGPGTPTRSWAPYAHALSAAQRRVVLLGKKPCRATSGSTRGSTWRVSSCSCCSWRSASSRSRAS